MVLIGDDVINWRYSETTFIQIKKVLRLKKGLDLNPGGIALALELISQIDDLRRNIKRFKL
ncbi:MAG: chaperone modulator CbpM [Rhodomicrobiaceae bacterium]